MDRLPMIAVTLGNTRSTLDFPPDQRDNIGAALQRHLMAEVPSAKFTWAFKSGAWDGKVRLFEPQESRFVFLTGLMPLVMRGLNESNLKINSVFNDLRGIAVQQFNTTNVPLRPYQIEGIQSLIGQTNDVFGWWPRGILQVATGGGKTEMAVGVYEMNPRPTFFLVHRKDLLLQAEQRFKDYGLTPGVLGATIWKPTNNLNIATMQTVISVLKREDDSRNKELNNIIADTEQVFFDEAHLMASNVEKGNQFVQVAGVFDRAYCRWGLTATPFMRGQYDNLLLQGVTGEVAYAVSNSELIDLGFLTAPKVIMRKVPGTLPVTWEGKRSNKAAAKYWRAVYDKGVTFNSPRNKMIVEEIAKGPYPLLVLVKTIEQGKYIRHLHTLAYPNSVEVPILTGRASAIERRQAVADMEAGTLSFVIATTIFDEGVDIPELRKVILASGGKSQVKMLQRVGRVLRVAKGKQEAIIIDFQDKHHNMLFKHAQARKRVWKEQGFKVEVEK